MHAGSPLTLAENTLHIWTLRTKPSPEALERFGALLSDEERRRAMQFRLTQAREAFVAARGALRYLLGCCLDRDPAALRLVDDSLGKPHLACGETTQFSVAHSAERLVIALGAGCPIGVDVEQMVSLENLDRMVGRCFCPEEAAEILSLPPPQRQAAFFCCWTRKEAYSKATGGGLHTFQSFRVTVQPGSAARLVASEREASVGAEWTLEDLELGPGYWAAIAYRGGQRPLSHRDFADLAAPLMIP